MIVLYALLIGASIVLGLAFVASFGAPWRSEAPSMAWLQSMLALVAIAFDSIALLALFRLVPHAWVILVVLAAQDGVFAWRLFVLLVTRTEPMKGRTSMVNHPAAKAIVATIITALIAALVVAQTAIPMSTAAHGWVSVGLAFLGAVGTPIAVYKQTNAPAPLK